MSPARRLSLPARSQRPAPRPRPPLPRCLLLCQFLRALRGRWWKRKGQDPGHCEEGPCPSRAPSPGWPGLAAGALWVLLDSARVFFPPGEPVDADLAPSSPPSCGLVPLPGPAVLDQLPRVPRLPRTPRVCVCARVTLGWAFRRGLSAPKDAGCGFLLPSWPLQQLRQCLVGTAKGCPCPRLRRGEPSDGCVCASLIT